MEKQINQRVFPRPVLQGMKYGSIAGLLATWSISTAIAASELELRIPIGTFYAIIGISLGSNDPSGSAYLGFGLHLATGTILGAVIGAVAIRYEIKRSITEIFSPYRSVLMGVGTGILFWLILFLPLTSIIVQPSFNRIAEILSVSPQNRTQSVFDSNNIGQSFSSIAISAALFHVVWGAIFGFIISSLLRIRLNSLFPSAPLRVAQRYGFTKSPFNMLYFGLAAGLISSLAISGLILLVEKINSLPVGTFYYVLVSAVTNPYNSNTETPIMLGLATHVVAGSFIGLVMSIPFVLVRLNSRYGMNKKLHFVEKYSSVYGIAFGMGLWLLIFVPITFLVVIPFLKSFEFQDVIIRQPIPTGEVASATFFGLVSMMDRIIYGALAFNLFYGLLAAIILQSFHQKYPLIDDNQQRHNEADLLSDRG
ncbi:MAG: hypothetical protein M3261_00815 [Thermoproteota archaeon]|nr:hypothetical protein [Thermoproteota archaeon]